MAPVLLTAVTTVVAASLSPQAASADPPGTISVNTTAIPIGVGLGPGRFYGQDKGDGADEWPSLFRRRVAKTGPSTVSAGAFAKADDENWGAISVSANRVLYDWAGRAAIRYEGSTKRVLLNPNSPGTAEPVKLSGNRALYRQPDANGRRWPVLYNIADGSRWAPFGTSVNKPYPVDLWGQYFVYALPTGAVYRRDLRTGTTVQVKPAGGTIAAVAVYAQRVAWMTPPCTRVGCVQKVTWRTVGSATTSSYATQGTRNLRLGGGRFVIDFVFSGTRLLRTVDLATRAVSTIGQLALSPGIADFDLDDEMITWRSDKSESRLGPLPAHTESPRYLGTPIAPASFTPNGDGSNDLWRAALPLTKRLTDCRVTIRKNGTPVRIIGCAASTETGLATVAWDGRTGSGKPVSKGTYTWTLTGSDSDGSLLWYSGSGSPITGTFKVA